MPAAPAAAPAAVAWDRPAAPSVPGAAGFVYGDLPNRIIALIIDAIVLVVLLVVVGIVLGVVGLSAGFNVPTGTETSFVATLVYSLVGLAVSAVYFIGSWTRSRSTIGMRVLGMQVGNAFDGKTITMEQGVRRWLALWGPGTLASVVTGAGAIATLVSLASFIYSLYLLYSTSKSPTKQGFHDKFANTVVVKSARVA
jgi:uncharacterized RDD family membrane protein YckC